MQECKNEKTQEGGLPWPFNSVCALVVRRPMLCLHPNVHVKNTPYNTTIQLLQEVRRAALLHDQWMPVHTGHQTQADGSPYGLCDLPLVLRAQTGVLGVLYPAHFCHVLGHHFEVLPWSASKLTVSLQCTHLVLVHGVDSQHVERIALGLLAAELPLLLLGAGQIVGRVDVSGLPLAVDLALELCPPLRLDYLAGLCSAVHAHVASRTDS